VEATAAIESVALGLPKASLSEDFMSLFPTHPDFENSAEKFNPYETLSTLIKLLSSLFINMMSYQYN
jgi:hypothetical protein